MSNEIRLQCSPRAILTACHFPNLEILSPMIFILKLFCSIVHSRQAKKKKLLHCNTAAHCSYDIDCVGQLQVSKITHTFTTYLPTYLPSFASIPIVFFSYSRLLRVLVLLSVDSHTAHSFMVEAQYPPLCLVPFLNCGYTRIRD